MIFICNSRVLSHLLLICICKLHWNLCLSDAYWIGCSKAGTSSIAHYLNQHPMVQNIVGPKRAMLTHSKEGHFWEVSEHLFESSQDMIKTRVKAMQGAQSGCSMFGPSAIHICIHVCFLTCYFLRIQSDDAPKSLNRVHAQLLHRRPHPKAPIGRVR
jgi:hypothetical protein